MRRRLVQSTLAVAVVAVVLLGVPLGVAGAIVRLDAGEQQVQARAESIGRLVDDLATDDRPVGRPLVASRLRPTDHAVVTLADGNIITAGSSPEGGWIEGRYSSSAVEVVIRRDRSQVHREVLGVVLLVLTASVVAVVAAVGVGVAQARRLAAPLIDLARSAGRLGAGGSRPTFRRFGVEEVDRVAEVLEGSSERITTMLALERRFASDASHQLRTPLTALSMRLEEIGAADDLSSAREEAQVALVQVERLSAVVDHLLQRARESRSAAAAPLEVDSVLRQQLGEWTPAFSALKRSLRLSGTRGLAAVATEGGMAQVVSTLLDNSLVHGAGTVTVRTRESGAWVVVEVTDEGPGVPAELGGRVFERSVSGGAGTGLGLSLARDLAEADGGRLELLSRTPPVFALFVGSPGAAGEPAPHRGTRQVSG